MTAPTAAAQPDRPWLSIVLPTHDGERWLAATLRSLAAQTTRGFECILIDSSTSEATVAIAEAFRDTLPLKIERRPDVKDWTHKTNLGVERARAPHVCMLHQDDLWGPERAATVRRWLGESPDVALHLNPSWIVDARDRRLGLWRCPLPPGAPLAWHGFRDRIIVQNFVAICAPVMRRDAYLAVGGLDPSLWYTPDWDLYLKLGQVGPVLYHREALTSFRIHAHSQTIVGSRRSEDFERQMRIVLDRYRDGLAPDVLARAEASILVNAALAAKLHAQPGPAREALMRIAALGPAGIFAFFRDTRLVERLLPRLRVHLRGQLSA